MSSRDDLMDWIVEALRALGGSGSVLEVSKRVWLDHEPALRDSGDLFYTWQYDLRWAALKLRKAEILDPVQDRGTWTLANRKGTGASP